jgi:hypothetical protein
MDLDKLFHFLHVIGMWFGEVSGHRVIDITNGHFIHAGPLEGIGVSIYLVR